MLACFASVPRGAGFDASDANEDTHWAFKAVRRPAISNANGGSGRSTPIDDLVIQKLGEKKLTLSLEADRRILLRRLYFDLIGLPPSPEEVTAFVKDQEPRAYERLVEKLLASSRYGERWARHWFDVVRFAESHGFEMNQPRANAWPYRDYVIRALNEDKPYNQFILEQLAGDALGVDEATGFIVGGAWDQVKSPDPVLTANQRADELHDVVGTTGSAFLGLTVGCARCHNHKFDPIPQTDYFAIKAVFEGVQHGERKLRTAESIARDNELGQARERLAQVESELEQFEPLANPNAPDTNALRAAVNARKNVERFASVLAKRLRFSVSKTTDAEPCIDELEVYGPEEPKRNIASAANRTSTKASSVYPNSEIHRLEHLNDGKHGNSRSWISNERGKGWVEVEFAEPGTIDKVIWGRDREQRFADRLAIEYRIEVTIDQTNWTVIASSADRHPYLADRKKAALALADSATPKNPSADRLIEERAKLETRIGELAKSPMIYGGAFTAMPEATYRLHRGDAMLKREMIQPAGLRIIPVKFGSADTKESLVSAPAQLTEDQRRRLAFARWLIDPQNPLTARVMVNRVWQYHFGEGLVSTSSDFGVNGALPTHPELLDWLASEFIEHGWSIKHIHRLILNSVTYRRSSKARKDGLALDASSRLLWRFPSRRVEAEPIRDSILAVSGKLDLHMGGPGFSFFEPNDNYVRLYTPRTEWAPDTFRRMIYGTIIRQRPDGVFGAFDCPDAGQIAPKRGRSTTPLQAFNLLNSSFIVQQSGFFAERLVKEAGSDPKAQVRRAFALTFQREPDRHELAAATTLVREQGVKIFCRALFNANEFTHLD
ncbi:MAG TPA: DUF1549 and DUF1553 domain-containing protein [Candidatus Acidoferrum sp.]|nr:DUF1549 and DUF1553 domain-containing protein [Candidatus Acidoferrum sp.]